MCHKLSRYSRRGSEIKDRMIKHNAKLFSYSELRLRWWQTRTHCCGHIVAHDVSWVGKRAGNKTFVLCPCRANGETFARRTQKSSVSRTQNLCPQQMLPARANRETFVSATLCPRLGYVSSETHS